ncbi:MAG: hypothetical protein H0W83_16835 [Planctomycetes bacterium]|nr:hypothetical protein [Planctomycetota bacterium]
MPLRLWSSGNVLVLVLACASTAAAVDVDIRLKSGETAFGALVSQDEGLVSITRRVWTKNGVIAGEVGFPRAQILELVEVPSLPALYQTRAAKAGDEYEVQYMLARWCLERGLVDQAFTHAKALYERDHKDAVTAKLLNDIGYVLVDGQWVKETEYAEKHGLVAYDGDFLTPAEVELRKAATRDTYAKDTADKKVKTCEVRIENDTKRVKDAQERLAKAQADEAKKAEERRKERADARRQARGQAANNPPEKPEAEALSITSAKAAIESANKTLKKDRDDLKAAQDDAAKAAAALAAAKKSLADHQAKAADAKPADAPKSDAQAKADPPAK